MGQLPELKGVRDLFEQGISSEDNSKSNSGATGGDLGARSAPKKAAGKKIGKAIELQHDLQAAQQLATLEGRPLLAVFGADWCTWCRKLELELQEDEAESILKSWIVVRIDADEAVELSQSMNVNALPALRILDFQLNQVAGREGYLPIDELEAWLDEKYALANPAVQQVLFGEGPISIEDLQQLIELLADRSPKIRAAAVQRILPNRRQSAEAIIEIVQTGKLAQKLAALQILNSWKAPVDQIDPWVPETISEERSDKLRVWLSEMLAQESDPSNSTEESMDSSLESSEDSTTQTPPLDHDQAQQLIAQFLRDPAGGSSITNSTNVGRLGPVLREMVQSDALSDSDRQRLRELLYHALASRNTRLSESSLLVGLSSLNADTHRKASEKLLGKLSNGDLQLIDELSRDLDPLVREMSIPALDKIKALTDKDRLTRLLRDKSPSVRTAVLRAMSVNANTDAVDVLVEYTRSESDEDLLVFAAKTLGKIKLKKSRDAMNSLLKHSSWRIRAAALDAIAESLENRSSFQSSASTVLSDEFVDGVISALDDSDTFVVSRAQALLPKVVDGKNAEKIVGSLVRNPKSLSFWLDGDFHHQSSDSKDFSKAATKFLNSADENERLGAVRLLAKVAPIELKATVPTLLDQSNSIKIAGLEGISVMMARLRDQVLRPQLTYRSSSSSVSSHMLPKLQFNPWFEIPESLQSIPRDNKIAVSVPSTSQPSDADVSDSGSDQSSKNESITVDDLFGTPKDRSIIKDERLGSSTSGRVNVDNSKDPSAGLPSQWLDNYQKNGPKVFGFNPYQYDIPPLTDKEVKSLESFREKVEQQLSREQKGPTESSTSAESADAAKNYDSEDVQTWLEVASLALGDPTRSEVLVKKMEGSTILKGTDEQSKTAFRQFESALSWMPGEQRLVILQKLRLDWRRLTEQQKIVLNQATVINYLPIADWLLQESQKYEGSDGALTEIQKVMTRSLFGQLIDVNSRPYFGSDWEESSQSNSPLGYKLSIDWMEQSFHATQSAKIRSMLLGTLSYVDFELAKQAAVGYLSQATQDEGSLTQIAIALSLSDKPEFSADRAAQWLGHSVKTVREASIRRLTSTAAEFSEAIESNIKVKLKSYYFRDEDNVQPGFTFVRREIPVDLVRAFAADESSKLVMKYRTILFVIEPRASLESCIDIGDPLTSQSLVAAAIVKSNRTGEEVEQFFKEAHKDFLEFQAGLDEPDVSAQLRMYYWSLSKMRGERYVALRNELRKKFPALSD